MKIKQKKIHNQTISRRSLLDWLGKSAVIALGSELLASSCEDLADEEPQLDDDNNNNSTDDDVKDSDLHDAGIKKECAADEAFEFTPGPKEGPLLGDWPVRTVDIQDLKKILGSWQLQIDGLVETAAKLSFSDMMKLNRFDQVADFHCVEGWSIWDVPWNGVHLKTLFDLAQPTAAATHVTFHTVGGTYNESLPIEVALEPKSMLAYGIDCATLPLKHGFPLRLVVPRLLGYKSAKYVYRIELTDKPIEGFWVANGYPYEGLVPEKRLRPGRY
jgi:hypothetical protein